MKKNIIYLFMMTVVYFGYQYIISYTSNPKVIKIDDIYLKLPHMNIQNIFGGIETESKTFLDLILKNDPYEINYPESEMVNIMLSMDGEKGAILSLIPTLTIKSLSTYSESNRTQKFKNCILSNNREDKYNNIQIYIVNTSKNKGYAVFSENNKINKDIIDQICK